jgi:uncharacterized protein (TIGR03085 family)
MAATQVLLKERAALCDTFEKYGSEAPTLCEGWLTLDLAAHMVAREARSDAAVGLVFPPLAGHLQKVMDQYKTKGFETLVGMLRTGPPWMHRTGPLATANVNENYVHHEDVRRASGEGPRVLDDEMDAILWRMLGFGARMSKKAVKGAALTHARRSRADRLDRRHSGRDDGTARRARALHVRAQGSGRRHARRRAHRRRHRPRRPLRRLIEVAAARPTPQVGTLTHALRG